MCVGYKTLSYSAELSSISIKRHTFPKLKFLQPKFTRIVFRLLCILPENLISINASRTLQVNNFFIEQPDSVSSALH